MTQYSFQNESPEVMHDFAPEKDSIALPASFGQHRLWFIQHLNTTDYAYNIPNRASLNGSLNVEILQQSINEIVQRHEILRTSFSFVDGQLMQIIAPALHITLNVIDLRAFAQSEKAEQIKQVEIETIQRPFDLTQEPLFRLRLMRTEEQEYRLLFVIHHIIFDGWSMHIFEEELTALYAAFTQNRPSPLQPLVIQYADFAAWQKEQLDNIALAQHLAYWERQLADVPLELELPTDYPYPPEQKGITRGATETACLPFALQEALKELSRREGVTLFITLFTAFEMLLYQYTHQQDMFISTPVTTRPQTEVEQLIGFFINTLVLRVDLKGDPSFRQLLHRVQETYLQAHVHQALPFEKLVEHLLPERGSSQTPFTQVVFVLQNTTDLDTQTDESLLHFEVLDNGTAKCDLHLAMTHTPKGLQTTIEYRTDLFEPATIQRMLRQLEAICSDIVCHPDQHLSAFSPLAASERYQILNEWSTTRRDHLRPASFQQLFAEQVTRTPDALALVTPELQLTYHQLDTRANQLAHLLRTHGVGPEIVVGVLAPRSLSLLLSLLAILKADGIYLPLDPAYPPARLSFLLEDAQPTLLLAHPDLPALDLPTTHPPLLVLNPLELSSQPMDAPDSSFLSPEQGAYLIYTSGSTGTPKGVLVSHRGIANLQQEQHRLLDLTRQGRILLCASPSFDASLFEIVMALLSGSTLILSDPTQMQAGPWLAQALDEEAITAVTLTPSVLASIPMHALPHLHTLVVAGEPCPPALIETWAPGRGFFNAYGPTEATIWATVARCQPAAPRVSIGRPIANTRLFLLDETLQPVAPGSAGEIYLGGVGLSRGYLHQEALTAERFVPDPLSDEPGQRLYRTGDLARYTPTGQIEYLGRGDRQVKIRGIRIELGEIEQALLHHPAVQSAVLVAREQSENYKQLVAYLVCDHPTPDGNKLRDFLSITLPDHMLPAAFVFLDTLPLTPNGKLNYRVLPAPIAITSTPEREVSMPQSEMENILVEIWQDVLDIEPVSIHDGFFDLGGDSMLSIRILALAEERGINLSLTQIFQNTTIARLAQKIQSNAPQMSPAPTSKQAFQLLSDDDYQKIPEGIEDAYPLTMLQTGMLFHSEYTPERAIYHDISYAQIQAPCDLPALRRAIAQLVQRHPVLRTSFDLSTFSEPLQLIHQHAAVLVQLEDLRQFSTQEQEHYLDDWTTVERAHRFDWTQAPLLRLSTHRLTDNLFRLTITKHHTILDGWSLASLFTELLQVYMAQLAPEAPMKLKPLSSRYVDFVAAEQEILASEEARSYWAKELADSSSIRLPRWMPEAQAPHGVRDLSVPLTQELSDRLKQVAQTLDVPLKSVLLAAHMRVLGLLGGQTDVLTGLVTNGRLETTDGEQILGLFLNTLPYRHHLNGGSWAALIRATFESERALLPFRRYPLARIQQEQDRGALFEILFNFVHFHVYHNLQAWQSLHFLGENDVGENNFTISTGFSLDTVTARLGLNLIYDTSQITETLIHAIATYYVNALTALVTNPDADYTATPLLSEQETHQLVTDWNTTGASFDQSQTTCDLFAASVARTPDAIAACIDDAQITYEALDQRANQCAHHLKGLGVRPEVTVGLCVEPSLEMLIGLLGILKAGGAYVPLDPTAPPQRLHAIVDDAEIVVVITLGKFARQLPTTATVLLCLDEDHETLTMLSTQPLERQQHPQNAAYVLYTSGSTGQPKGVIVAHSQLLNYVQAMIQRLQPVPAARFAFLHTLSVDFGLTTLFTALCTGGSLSLLPRAQVTDAQAMLAFAQRRGIDYLKITPSHLAALPAEHQAALVRSLHTLILGGEGIQAQWAQKLRDAAPTCTILNHYGPTETTVGVLTYWLPGKPSAGHATNVPLGRPLANTQVYLLNTYLEPVPIGVAGELYIGGVSVTRGYLHKADLTAASYLPDPFSSLPGARLYKTGDLARYTPDGLIEFLGRKDDQVKIRGYRVEPGEVASALRNHPSVKEAIVLARTENASETYLVAYIVANEVSIPTSAELTTYLQTRVPAYMLPDAFVYISKLPLLPHGKVDRRQLAQMALPRGSRQQTSSYVAPHTPVEIKLAAIWEELLKVEQIGVNDNFFILGGHSLLAMQIISRIRMAFQIDLPIRFLFETPTIATLALNIEQAQARASHEEDDMRQILATIENLSPEEVEQFMKKHNLQV